MIKFQRDKNGMIVAYKNNKKIGKVVTMADADKKNDKDKKSK